MEQKEINIKLFNENKDFLGECGEQCINYIDNMDIIINKNNNLKLNYRVVKMTKNEDLINYNNYNFSNRFINIKAIISLLDFFDLKTFNTYDIYNFFNINKEKYNIWKYLNNSEYINYNIKSDYDKFVILRICLSYSWKECLYDLLIKCININRCYKTFIWIDIFCVNQFNKEIKLKGLDKIDDIYHMADVYNISSLNAFERYWCCYEMSLKKKSIDGILLDKKDLYKSSIYMNILKELFNNVFDNNTLFNNDNSKIYKYISEFQKIQEFEKNKFTLENAKITFDRDKKLIEGRIKSRYGSIEEYEKRMNIYIYLIKYRDDMKYVYLANRIMEV